MNASLSTLFAAVVDHLDDGVGISALMAAVERIVPADLATSLVYRRDLPPIYVYDTLRTPTEKRALQIFIASSYVLDPAYNAFLTGLRPGIHRMRDLTPDAYCDSDFHKIREVRRAANEEMGYITEGWPEGTEELVVTIDVGEGLMAEVALNRHLTRGGFDEDDLAALRDAYPLIASLYKRIWTVLKPSALESRRAQPDAGDLAPKILSPREQAVALMILKGHSNESIALNLGVSLATVKTHRQRIYAKLSISSQRELFARFMTERGLSLPWPQGQ